MIFNATCFGRSEKGYDFFECRFQVRGLLLKTNVMKYEFGAYTISASFHFSNRQYWPGLRYSENHRGKPQNMFADFPNLKAVSRILPKDMWFCQEEKVLGDARVKI